MIRVLTFLGTVSFVLMLVACRSEPVVEQDAGLTRESTTEGLHVTVQVSFDEMTTSEMLEVTVIVRVDESLKTTFPEVIEKWGDFYVFNTRTTPAKLGADGMVVQSRVYTLEPDIPGESNLSGLLVKATDERGEVVQVTTEPITVDVVSVLKPGEAKMKDIAPNDRPPVERESPRWLMVFFIVNVVIVICVIVVWLTRKEKQVSGYEYLSGDFDRLETAPVTEVMSSIERSFCRVIAHQRGIPLTKNDFAGLHATLKGDEATISGLSVAVAEYEKLQYASQTPSEDQVRALYSHFKSIVNQYGKETVS